MRKNRKVQKILRTVQTAAVLAVFCIGMIHVIAGQADKAVETVETAYQRHDVPPAPTNAEKSSVPHDAYAESTNETVSSVPVDGFSIPQYAGEPYELVNNNIPAFTDTEFNKASSYFEDYSQLDGLGRCGTAEASFGPDTIPTKKRGDIGNIKPSGWKQAKYKGIGKDGAYDPDSVGYLYNRSHLLMYALGGNGGDGSNNGSLNLVTGTRYMNVQGMLPFENKALYYVKDTGNRVLYRVTPVFDGNELVPRGVHMECASVEDRGQSLSFNVFVFNVQPHIVIDYRDGSSKSTDGADMYAGKS